MSDDWCSPTGEFEPARGDVATGDGARLRNRGETPAELDDEGAPVLGVTAGELRMVDAFFHEVALEAAADPRPPTPAEQLAVDNLRARFERLKAMTPEEEAAERQRLLRLDR
jgi:hypothetical protein